MVNTKIVYFKSFFSFVVTLLYATSYKRKNKDTIQKYIEEEYIYWIVPLIFIV